MSRKLPEWVGTNDDQVIPPRVKLRVAGRAEYKCCKCDRECGGRLKAEYDHAIPLILGGEHRENNIQLLCSDCHKGKSKIDVRLKAKVARVRKKRLGIRRPSQFACSKDSRWKKKIDGTVIPRR